MKTLAMLLFALISLCLLPNPTHSTFNPIRLPTTDVTVASGDAPVLDTDGNALRAGETYYISNVLDTVNLRGPQLAWVNSTTQCGSDVIMATCPLYGDPVRITPVDPNATVVLQSAFLSLAFSVPTSPLCAGSVYWGVQYDHPSGEIVVKSVEFDSDLTAQFKIESYGPRGYVIRYCPVGDNKCYFTSVIYDQSGRATRWILREGQLIIVAFRKTGKCYDFTE